MWGSRSAEVTCIACGAELPRSDAREYDKHGDRWGARDREFEYLCKPCHRECCHQPREGLEAALVRAGAGHADRETFLGRYRAVAADGDAPADVDADDATGADADDAERGHERD